MFKTAVVQRNRVASSIDTSQPYPTPQVHAMIYEPGNGELKELDVHFDNHFAAFSHMYQLYNKKGQLPLPPTDASMLHDILESVLLDRQRHDDMQVMPHNRPSAGLQGMTVSHRLYLPSTPTRTLTKSIRSSFVCLCGVISGDNAARKKLSMHSSSCQAAAHLELHSCN